MASNVRGEKIDFSVYRLGQVRAYLGEKVSSTSHWNNGDNLKVKNQIKILEKIMA